MTEKEQLKKKAINSFIRLKFLIFFLQRMIQYYL